MDRIKKDPRFAHVLQDPRFRRIPKEERKVKIDKRFKGMFDGDDEFRLNYPTDKRGKPINRTSKEDLKKFYRLSSSESASSDEDDTEKVEKVTKNVQKVTEKVGKLTKTVGKINNKKTSKIRKADTVISSSECASSDDDDTEKVEKITKKEKNEIKKRTSEISSDSDLKASESDVESGVSDESSSEASDNESEADEVDLARGEGNVESCDGSTTESEDEDEDAVEHAWGELDTDATETSEITRRLAVCNMDWDRIKAGDIYVLCNSFKPSDGIIQNVKIYPSEYGKSRMKEEDLSGPKELVEEKIDGDEEEDEQDVEGSAYHMEKLRKYQLNRLRYYYAVVECDSAATANKIYEECTGIEYESSAVRLDLRFIPDSMTFDDVPTSCADSMPEPETYKPSLFTTTALQQAKVQLTWDETDPDRVRLTQKAFDKKDGDKVDLRAYLASSEEENDDEEEDEEEDDDDGKEDSVAKYRALLLSIEDEEKKKKERDVEMEISWTPGLKETTQEMVKKKRADEKELTPWDEYLKKKKEKRSQKRMMKKGAGGDAEYSDDDLPDDVNLNDDFFTQDLGPEFEKSSKPKKDKKFGKKKRPTSPELEDSNKAELDLLLMEDDDGKKHFDMKSLLRKGKTKSKTQETSAPDAFKFDVNDERFSEIFTSHQYHIDPSDPQFKMSEGMQMIMKEKEKRRNRAGNEGESANKRFKNDVNLIKPCRDAELKSLVKSVKNRTHIHQLKRQKRK